MIQLFKIYLRKTLFGLVAKLERYSQLNKIIEYLMNGLSSDLNCELILCSNFLSDVNDISDEVVAGKSREINFLCEQMKLNTFEKHGERYAHHTMREAINLYLRSGNAYNAARDLLVLAQGKTIKKSFGKLGSPECSSVVKKVFEKLVGMERRSKILVDEIHISLEYTTKEGT